MTKGTVPFVIIVPPPVLQPSSTNGNRLYW